MHTQQVRYSYDSPYHPAQSCLINKLRMLPLSAPTIGAITLTVPCQVSTAEMREAFRLNLNSSLCWKLARGNSRILIYLLAFIGLVVWSMTSGGPIDWEKVATYAGLAAFIALLLLFGLNRTVAKTARALNKSSNTLTVDSQGLMDESPNGTRTFVPWSAVTRWREGKLVFTIGDAKTFRTIAKKPLGETQSGELRSLLLSQIR